MAEASNEFRVVNNADNFTVCCVTLACNILGAVASLVLFSCALVLFSCAVLCVCLVKDVPVEHLLVWGFILVVIMSSKSPSVLLFYWWQIASLYVCVTAFQFVITVYFQAIRTCPIYWCTQQSATGPSCTPNLHNVYRYTFPDVRRSRM